MVISTEIENQILSLPLEERARLADRLLTSLVAPASDTWFEAVDSEVNARMEAFKRGEIASVDGEAAIARMWGLLR